MTAGVGAIRAGRAFVELFADDSKLVRGLKQASRKLEAWGKGIRNVGLSLSAAGAAIVTPLVGSAKTFAEIGSEMEHMSARTGVPVEALSELAYAAELSGTSVELLEIGLRRMQRLLTEAALGSQTAKEALAMLGLTMQDLNGLKPDEQFKLIADRISQIENPAVRTAAAIGVFGRQGAGLLPMLLAGSAGIERLQERARALGLTMSTEDAQAAERFHRTLEDLWKVLKKCWFTIGAALAPTLPPHVVPCKAAPGSGMR